MSHIPTSHREYDPWLCTRKEQTKMLWLQGEPVPGCQRSPFLQTQPISTNYWIETKKAAKAALCSRPIERLFFPAGPVGNSLYGAQHKQKSRCPWCIPPFASFSFPNKKKDYCNHCFRNALGGTKNNAHPNSTKEAPLGEDHALRESQLVPEIVPMPDTFRLRVGLTRNGLRRASLGSDRRPPPPSAWHSRVGFKQRNKKQLDFPP